MIEAIGIKRIMLILVLAVVAGILAMFNYYVFVPQAEAAQAQLNTVRAKNAELTADIEKMRADITQFEEQKSLYEKMVKVGFFNDQDRVLARERFDVMQKLSKLIAAKYEIRPASIEPSDVADKAGFGILSSPINITLSAIDDLDVYRFIYYLTYAFPGHVTIKNIAMERKAEVNPSILKQIGTGKPSEMIGAQMELEWRTMARKESILPGSIAPPAAGQMVQGGM